MPSLSFSPQVVVKPLYRDGVGRARARDLIRHFLPPACAGSAAVNLRIGPMLKRAILLRLRQRCKRGAPARLSQPQLMTKSFVQGKDQFVS